MLAGLIFAIEDASDRPGTLVATLPFGGMTLLEYQVRLLVGAGAQQVLIAVGRMTPALLAAINRASRRDIALEVVRSAEEAAEKMTPGTRVLVLADGLVTTDPVMDRMGSEGPEALLVTDQADSPAAIERLDMRDCWAGMARISLGQLKKIAEMPDDYDFQSALLRVASQSGADHVPLTGGWLRGGHAVERSAEGLAARNTGVLAALSDRRADWANRWVFTRVARLALPELVARNIPDWGPLAAGGLLGVGALAALAAEWTGTGLVVSLLSAAALSTAASLTTLRGEERRSQQLEWAMLALFGGVTLVAGWVEQARVDAATPMVLAMVAAAAQFLVERVPARPRRWWASPAAHLLMLTPFALAGWVGTGLGLCALYAFGTLAGAIEATREKA
ncbi:hypothetical protein [Sphingomonas xinjiangensis]|uniref:Uncharacterized protein n=1 Tax=Sphingomonas xinjiangensis TaxID=643568 RepID=A0A840Y9K1_9SPHN|nr:hypothetical protein [Sphingomonas xinjiangensis]MBB5708975.1 hypothetical protein [Sphingomonas xinjiangensis]